MKIRKWVQKMDGILITEIVAISIMLVPVFIISFYTIPSTDDFNNFVTIRTALEHHHFYINAAISEVIYYYKNVSGYYFAAFLNFYISPFLRGGIVALRITVFLINFFFFVSLYFLYTKCLIFFITFKNLK